MDQSSLPFAKELEIAIAAAKEAAVVVHDLYERAAAESYVKGDGSPVTDADLAADQIISDRLTSAFPNDGILTEEGADDQARLTAARCWLVDPIDGTQQFINRTGEFDVLIALVIDQRPVLGLLLQPTTGKLLSATKGGGAWFEENSERRPLRFAPAQDAPRLETSTWLGAPENLPTLNRIAARLGGPPPEVSKLGVTIRQYLPPANNYDVLIGLDLAGSNAMGWEWDFAAADIVANEAGANFTDLEGNLHRYNKPVPRNLNGLVFAVDPHTHSAVIRAVAAEREESAAARRARG